MARQRNPWGNRGRGKAGETGTCTTKQAASYGGGDGRADGDGGGDDDEGGDDDDDGDAKNACAEKTRVGRGQYSGMRVMLAMVIAMAMNMLVMAMPLG